MPRVRSLPFLVLAVTLLAGARMPAAEKRDFSGAWREIDVRVDGLDEEWRAILQPVKGEHFSIGFLNDDEALYLCLVTKDGTTIRQISRMGLVVWIDPAGGQKRGFGVRFPVGPAERSVGVLGPGRKDAREVENGPSGIAAKMRVGDDLLVYEMRIPLRTTGTAPLAPGVEAGAALRVELQTPEWRGPVPMRRGWPRVGVGVGRGGVMYPGADMAMLKPLEVTGSLKLASHPGE